MTMAYLVVIYASVFACSSQALCNDVAKEGCAVSLAEPAGDLHLLQASVKKIMPGKLTQSETRVEQDPLGDSSCKCIGIALEGSYPLKMDNDTASYPAKTGASCAAWDAGRAPGCEAYNPPDWCTKKWCYVDPCSCGLDVPPKKTSGSFMWQGKPAYWSYATCGEKDSYSETLEKACPNAKDSNGCKKLDDCAWDGKQCVGKDIVDACKKDDLDEKVYGKSDCKCVGMAPKDGTVTISFDNNTALYPGSIGGNCSAWDDKNYPDCKGSKAPAWCKQKWCYVDPCKCKLPDTQPKQTVSEATYQGNPAFWSYATCGGKDEFTEDLSKLPDFPPAFCPGSKAATPAPTPAPPIDLGNPDCECIGLDIEGESPLTATSEDEMGKPKERTVAYPANLGSSCKAWDVSLYPGCEVNPPPEWCSAKWCYIDPCKCTIPVPPKKTTQNYTWQGKQLYWSYATCGGSDTFSAQNPMACVSQDNEDYCLQVKGCAWDGSKCLGKDLVNHCSTEIKEKDYGLDTCRCVGWEKEGFMDLLNKSDYPYPASVGGKCSSWDADTHPDCKGKKPAAWCKQKWCYVDPCSCTLPDTQPKVTTTEAFYKGKPVFWSYATCGGKDEFTEDLDNLPAFPPDYCSADTSAPESKSQACTEKRYLGLVMIALAVLGGQF